MSIHFKIIYISLYFYNLPLMQLMNEKIDATHDLAKRLDDKVTLLNVDFLGTRADVLALKRAK